MRHLEVPKSIKCEEPPQHVNLCLRNQGVKFSTLLETLSVDDVDPCAGDIKKRGKN